MLAHVLFALLPTVAYPFSAETLHRADVQSCAEQVLRASGYSRRGYERAAFLILRDDGQFDCRMWPATFQWQKEEWRGPIPNGTAAVIHSHPRNEPWPSTRDAAEAARLDIAMMVVTPQGLSMAQPDGRILAQSSRIAAAPGALLSSDEASPDRQTHTRQAGALSHQRP